VAATVGLVSDLPQPDLAAVAADPDPADSGELTPPKSTWEMGDEPETPIDEPVDLPTLDAITKSYEERDHPLDPPAVP
jgi:hypothetical protein